MKNSPSLHTKIDSPIRAQLILTITETRAYSLLKLKSHQSLLWWLMDSQIGDGKKKKERKKNGKMENKDEVEKAKDKGKISRGRLSTCNTDILYQIHKM